MVTSTGRIESCPCVRALNSLQNDMMLIPCGPSAVPTGGAGFALPAGICSLTKPVIFLAIKLLSVYSERAGAHLADPNSHGVFKVVVVADRALLVFRPPRARATGNCQLLFLDFGLWFLVL